MSVDRLQEKIRKTKTPFLLDLGMLPETLPPEYCTEPTVAHGWGKYCLALLETFRGKLPGVRFSFSAFSLYGPDGLCQLQACLKAAGEAGYYVLLDAPELWSLSNARFAANLLLGTGSLFPCDGLVVPGYLGSDIWKAFLPFCKDDRKDVFVVARTGNKSAPEIQDLLTGSRQVHLAVADHVNRSAGDLVGKCGYSRIGVAAAASSQETLKNIRTKYPKLFVLVDGLDYPGGTVKNCAAAFDKLGHGAAICTGLALVDGWKQADTQDPMKAAEEAAERLRKNISRYVTIL